MPLVALHDGQRLESWLMSASEWAGLKAGYRVTGLTMSCGRPGYPKTSPLGLQFFSHTAGSDCELHEGGPESPEHLAAEAAIAYAARAVGWKATVEFANTDRTWIADVLVEKDGRRIALEVQWSQQKSTDFLRRQHRYEADGVECIWFSHERNRAQVSGVPSHELHGTVDNFTALLPTVFGRQFVSVALTKAVNGILGGQIRPRIEVHQKAILISTAKVQCWKKECKKWMTWWYLTGVELETRCGEVGYAQTDQTYQSWLTERVESFVEGEVRIAVSQSDLPAAAVLARRYSRTVGHSYLAFNCPTCGEFQGDGFLPPGRRFDDYVVAGSFSVPLTDALLARQHMCKDIGRGHCTPIQAHERTPRFDIGTSIEPGHLINDYEPLPPRRPRRKSQQSAKSATARPSIKFRDDTGLPAERPYEAPPPPVASTAIVQPIQLPLPPHGPPLPTPSEAAVSKRFAELRFRCLVSSAFQSPTESVRAGNQVRPVSHMTENQLLAELKYAFGLLDNGTAVRIASARQHDGMADNLPELLGEFLVLP